MRSGFLRWRMSFSDLPSPAEALVRNHNACQGFAQAGNRYPLFRDMRERLAKFLRDNRATARRRSCDAAELRLE